MTDLWSILPGGLLVFLPGYALSRLVPREDMEPFQRAIVSVGLSLALMPLLLIWTTEAGLYWGGPAAWALVLLSGLVAVWTWPKSATGVSHAPGGATADQKALPGSAGAPGAQPPRAIPTAGDAGEDGPDPAQTRGGALLLDTAHLPNAAQLAVQVPRRHGFKAWCRQNVAFFLLAVLFLASLAVRLVAIRELSLPLWGDSLHHSWVARLIAERGQAPDSFYPYFPLDSVTYHFGYHTMAAFFSWTTGLPVERSVLVFGQVLNALSVLTVYLLAHRLTRSHKAALLSALVVGLISQMPAYYVNWGRYTQLAGQVILPAALFLAVEAVERRNLGYLALAGAAAAGLFVTHYRVMLFYVAFLAVYLAWRMLASASRDRAQVVVRKPVGRPGIAPAMDAVPDGDSPPVGDAPPGGGAPAGRLYRVWDMVWAAGVGLAALVLAFPRWWYLAVNLPRGESSVPQLSPEAWDQWMISYNALGEVDSFLSWPLLALAAAGFPWALLRRERAGIVAGGWVALLLLMANAERLGLGRGAWLNNFAVLIALYIPASIVIGWLGAQVMEVAGRAWRAAPYVLAGLAAVAGLWGGWGMANMLDTRYILVTPADQRAMAWIQDNTPEDSRFLVNYFFAFGGRFVVGSDGGWWLSYLTGRESNVPPILYGAESSPERDYAARTNALARSLQGYIYTREGQLLMQEERITNIFIGEKGGFLDPNKLLAAGHQAVYRDGPVWVFKVNYAAAGP